MQPHKPRNPARPQPNVEQREGVAKKLAAKRVPSRTELNEITSALDRTTESTAFSILPFYSDTSLTEACVRCIQDIKDFIGHQGDLCLDAF